MISSVGIILDSGDSLSVGMSGKFISFNYMRYEKKVNALVHLSTQWPEENKGKNVIRRDKNNGQ
ncbi:MAG TPA: hypothetical protein VFR61_08385 [Nitrososphaeraceae archaeon]|nr:hypothetical protein [Nitrososphaeraceae archaeon]